MWVQDNKPRYIYKYKRIETKEDLIRLLDIFENNRIYLPTYTELNDPLEGAVMNLNILGKMGGGIARAADLEDVIVKEYKEKYRILSLSEDNNNPQLWAHYAGDYTGICLCFYVNDVFEEIKKIEYYDKAIDLNVKNTRELSGFVQESFFKKLKGWEYEKEWRLLKKTSQRFLRYNNGTLSGIIIGHKMSSEVKDFIVKSIPNNIEIFRTYVGYRSVGLKILKYNYKERVGTGKVVKGIDVEKVLDKKRREEKK